MQHTVQCSVFVLQFFFLVLNEKKRVQASSANMLCYLELYCLVAKLFVCNIRSAVDLALFFSFFLYVKVAQVQVSFLVLIFFFNLFYLKKPKIIFLAELYVVALLRLTDCIIKNYQHILKNKINVTQIHIYYLLFKNYYYYDFISIASPAKQIIKIKKNLQNFF